MLMADDQFFSVAKIVLITSCTLGMMSTLTVFKFNMKKVFTILGFYMLWVGLSSWVILTSLPYNTGIRFFLFTISAPAIFLAYRMDKDSPTQSVFNYTTQINFSLLISVAALILNTALEGNQYTDLMIRVVLYSVIIFFEYRFLRKPFRRLAEVITSGWGILSLIPVFFCIMISLLGTFPVHYSRNPVNTLFIFGIAVTMLVVYVVVYQSLMRQYRLQLLMRDKDILQVQISAMNKQAEAVFAAEEKLRILRHDVRHFAGVMQSNLQNGSALQAAAVLSTFEAAIDATATKSYCNDYVLNSTLASCFERAEKAGILVNVQFCAPPQNKVNTTAFSVALSNALENALEACTHHNGSPSIELKSRIFHGQYLMELSNTCTHSVLFDDDGLPISEKGEGHGIGTRSILAFAEDHNATVHFQVENDRFLLQMMINLEDM